MKKRATAVGIVALASLLVPMQAHASETTCDGREGAGPYENVVVPERAECDLSGDTVTGNVRVEPGGKLRAGDGDTSTDDGAEIHGNLEADRAEWIELRETTVGGNVEITGTASSPPPALSIDPALDSAIESILGDTTPNVICDGSQIGGNLLIAESVEGAPWRVGVDQSDSAPVSPNCGDGVLVDGNASFESNEDTVEVIGNQPLDAESARGIDGNASVLRNVDVDVRDNDVAGELTCAENADGDNAANQDSGSCEADDSQTGGSGD